MRRGLPLAFFLYPGHQVQTAGSPVGRYTQFGVDQDCPGKRRGAVIIDKDGKVYLTVSDANMAEKKEMIEAINTSKNIGLTDAEKANFVNVPNAYIGAPFSPAEILPG